MGYKARKTPNEKTEFLIKVATLYYINGLSQQEIADQLELGRTSVVRFLNEAREQGVVNITIKTPTENYRNHTLEDRLIVQFGLKDCLVINDAAGSFYDIVPKYLNTLLPYRGVLGIGGGRTMYSLGKNMWLCDSRPDLHVAQLTGSLGNIPETSVAQLWSDSLSAKGVYINAPLLAQNRKSKELLMEDPTIGYAIGMLKKADTCVIGIGANEFNSRLDYLKYFPEIDEIFVKTHSIGDIIFNFFDDSGNFTIPEVSDRVIGIPIEDCLKIRTRIGVAYGPEKVRAVRAALKASLVNIFATDTETAELLAR